jgi:hypothetical protein
MMMMIIIAIINRKNDEKLSRKKGRIQKRKGEKRTENKGRWDEFPLRSRQ